MSKLQEKYRELESKLYELVNKGTLSAEEKKQKGRIVSELEMLNKQMEAEKVKA